MNVYFIFCGKVISAFKISLTILLPSCGDTVVFKSLDNKMMKGKVDDIKFDYSNFSVYETRPEITIYLSYVKEVENK